MSAQELLNSFYDIDNIITFNITVAGADWETLKNAEPRGGFGYEGSRFDWFHASSVSVSGTNFPHQAGTFYNVGIIKKSFFGSFSKTKPSLRLDFAKFEPTNETGIEALIGTKYVTLNNSIQDPSYIRQPLGYELFRQAGVPRFRCNFARVVVNTTLMGVYVNLEPCKRFLDYNFAGNTKGNLYEIELSGDLTPDKYNTSYVSFEGFSDYEDKLDLKLAVDAIAGWDIDATQQLVGIDAFIRFSAMELLLKHWDGYTQNRNNAYMYNNTKAVANPGVDNVKLEFIPSGIDQIFQETWPFSLGYTSSLGHLFFGNASIREKWIRQIREYADEIFSPGNIEIAIWPFIDRARTALTSAGVLPTDINVSVNIVRSQVENIKREVSLVLQEDPASA